MPKEPAITVKPHQRVEVHTLVIKDYKYNLLGQVVATGTARDGYKLTLDLSQKYCMEPADLADILRKAAAAVEDLPYG